GLANPARAAGIGPARRVGHRLAGTGPVAGPRGRERRARAARGDAGGPGRVEAAGAAAVAAPVLTAAGRALVGALIERILAGRHGGAGADATRKRARFAGPGASGPAADPLLAEPGLALGGRRASRHDRLLAAAAAVAGVGRVAVGVCRARRAAGAVR